MIIIVPTGSQFVAVVMQLVCCRVEMSCLNTQCSSVINMVAMEMAGGVKVAGALDTSEEELFGALPPATRGSRSPVT